jgi:hypothetical protein
MKRVLTMLALAGVLSACNDDPPPPVEPEPPRAEAPKPAPEIEPTPEEVPIPEDFEAEAEKEVSPSNLTAQLDALEEEIKADVL